MVEEKDLPDLNLFRGQTNLLAGQEDSLNPIEIVESSVRDLCNVKNLHFLLGAGVSRGAVPTMTEMKAFIEGKVKEEGDDCVSLFKTLANNTNGDLETMLGALYSKKSYSELFGEEYDACSTLIEVIEDTLFEQINVNLDTEEVAQVLSCYQVFYKKLSYRQRGLARVNVFTTNNDLLNEKALDFLNIDFNNGFGGGIERVFNPARFTFTFSRQLDPSLERYEPIENMIYLYKLHGSISWVEGEANSLFDIFERPVSPGSARPKSNVLIYPTPLKQNMSLGSPYADLIRECQTRLLMPNSTLIVCGYSFSDEHINNIVYRVLSANPSLNILILGNYKENPLSKLEDRRVYRLFGELNGEKVHYFEYFVNNLLPDLEVSLERDQLQNFVEELSGRREQ